MSSHLTENVLDRRKYLVVFLFLLIPYVLSLNPYLEPETYDNIVYLEGAKSLVEEGRYYYSEKMIIDWPPMMSLFLAVPYFFGLNSVLVSKILVLFCVIWGAWLALRVLEQENYEYPRLSFFLFMVSPTVFIYGTRVMTEWPYVAFSMLFLFLFEKLQKERSLFLAILTGLILGICFLLRYVGITLLFAVATVVIQRLYRSTKSLDVASNTASQIPPKGILLETLVVAVGCSLFALWLIPLLSVQLSRPIASDYYSVSNFFKIHPYDLNSKMVQFLSKSDQLPVPQLVRYAIIAFVNLTMIIGFAHHIKKRGFGKIEGYVLGYLLLLLDIWAIYLRYFIPIAPFLYSYFLSGLQVLWPNKLKAVMAGSFIAFFLFLDFVSLISGNGKSYGGLIYWINSTPQQFYRGYWRDLYEVSAFLKGEPSTGMIGLIKIPDTKYVSFFSGRKAVPFDMDHDFAYLVIRNTDIGPNREMLSSDWTLLRTTNEISIYKSTSPMR